MATNRKDYYETLGISKNASQDDVKKAFHKMAHKYHPDKKGGDEAKFKEINEAYHVLSDNKRRAEYDAYGSTFGGGAGPGFEGFQGGFDFSQGFDLGDIFGEFFTGGQGQARRGRDISVDIQVSFAESIFGVTRKVLISKVGTCENCSGSGAEAGSKKVECKTCGGKGRIHETKRSFLGAFTSVHDCQTCGGSGSTPEHPCKVCGGHGVLKKTDEVSVAVPAGIQDGEMIRLTGHGEALSHGMSGDLYVKVHVERHQQFRREGNNIVMDLDVKLSDALLGTDYKIQTLDGDVTVGIPAGVSFGELLRVRGKGAPISQGKRGDLLIRVVIRTPQKLSRKAKDLIERLKEEGI